MVFFHATKDAIVCKCLVIFLPALPFPSIRESDDLTIRALDRTVEIVPWAWVPPLKTPGLSLRVSFPPARVWSSRCCISTSPTMGRRKFSCPRMFFSIAMLHMIQDHMSPTCLKIPLILSVMRTVSLGLGWSWDGHEATGLLCESGRKHLLVC